MNKQSESFWDEVLNGLDPSLTDRAAERFSAHNGIISDDFADLGKPVELKPAAKKSRAPLFVGLGAVTVAVAAAVMLILPNSGKLPVVSEPPVSEQTPGYNQLTKPDEISDFEYISFPYSELNSSPSLSFEQACCIDGSVIALTTDGKILTWGSNRNAKIGNGTFDGGEKSVPVEPYMIAFSDKIKSVGASNNMSYAITEYGEVYVWGNNIYGQTGTAAGKITSPQKLEYPAVIKKLSLGDAFALALSESGEVYASGIDVSQFSDIESFNLSIATEVNLSVSNEPYALTVAEPGYTKMELPFRVKDISIGKMNYALLSASGEVYVKGTLLGDIYGTTANITHSELYKIDFPEAIAEVKSGSHFVMARSESGNVYLYGNREGVFFDEANDKEVSENIFQKGTLSNIVSIDCNMYFACAVDEYGNAWCFGRRFVGTKDGFADFETINSPLLYKYYNIAACSVDISNSVLIFDDGSIMILGLDDCGQISTLEKQPFFGRLLSFSKDMGGYSINASVCLMECKEKAEHYDINTGIFDIYIYDDEGEMVYTAPLYHCLFTPGHPPALRSPYIEFKVLEMASGNLLAVIMPYDFKSAGLQCDWGDEDVQLMTLYYFDDSKIKIIDLSPYGGLFGLYITGDVTVEGDSLSVNVVELSGTKVKETYSMDFDNLSMKLESVQWPEDSGHVANDYFLGLCDEKLYYKDASYIVSCGLDITAEEARTAYCPTCTFEGWTYGIFSKGITLTTPEYEFDYEKMEFADPPVPEKTEYQYHKISVGDTFGGLTVKSARTEIITTEDNSIGHNGVYTLSCELAFSGEITVDGYAYALTNYGEEGAAPGDISFLFGAGEFDDIPMVIGWGYDAYPNVLPFAWRGSGFQYTSDTPMLFLSTPSVDFPELDVSGIPSDGTPVPVRVTLTDIRLLASDGNCMRSYAKPVAITVLS